MGVGRRGELVGGMVRRLCWSRMDQVEALVLTLGEFCLSVTSFFIFSLELPMSVVGIGDSELKESAFVMPLRLLLLVNRGYMFSYIIIVPVLRIISFYQFPTQLQLYSTTSSLEYSILKLIPIKLCSQEDYLELCLNSRDSP